MDHRIIIIIKSIRNYLGKQKFEFYIFIFILSTCIVFVTFFKVATKNKLHNKNENTIVIPIEITEYKHVYYDDEYNTTFRYPDEWEINVKDDTNFMNMNCERRLITISQNEYSILLEIFIFNSEQDFGSGEPDEFEKENSTHFFADDIEIWRPTFVNSIIEDGIANIVLYFSQPKLNSPINNSVYKYFFISYEIPSLEATESKLRNNKMLETMDEMVKTITWKATPSLDNCPQYVETFLEGKWEYPSYEAIEHPHVILNSDNTFILKEWVDKDYEIQGTWKFNEANYSIIFTLNELDEYFDNLLKSNLYDINGVLNYNYNEKSFELKLEYFETPQNFNGTCKPDRFYINFFNMNYYKVMDDTKSTQSIFFNPAIQQDNCISYAIENMIGLWRFDSSENAILELDLKENNEFIYSVFYSDNTLFYSTDGYWSYSSDSKAIKLTFNNLNDQWETTLKDDLTFYYPSVKSYSLDDKYIELEVNYFPREDYQGCEPTRYYINMMNNLLYKNE